MGERRNARRMENSNYLPYTYKKGNKLRVKKL
jgi:hypothetical protein